MPNPRIDDETKDMPEQTTSYPDPGAMEQMSPPNPLHILLVDDNPDDRMLVARELAREFPDLRITHVRDRTEFEQALARDDFHLVITDYQLRWSDGLAVLQAVKARDPIRPVIMFTGTGSEVIAVEAMKQGLDDYVVKTPAHFRRLPGAVRLALERAAQRRALARSEARFRHLFEHLPVGVFQATLEGEPVLVNPKLVEIMGYPDAETLLASDVVRRLTSPEAFRQWLEEFKRQGGIRDMVLSVPRYDGRLIWIRLNVEVVRDEAGRPLYVEGTVEDITREKEAQERGEQQARLAAVGQLAAGIAHDFNNLLGAILLYANLLSQDPGMSPQSRGRIETIANLSQQAARLIGQILDFSRRSVMERTPFDLLPFVKEMIKLLERTFPETTRLELEALPGEYVVQADPTRMQQVLMNLAINARDAMPEGGVLSIRLAHVYVDQGQEPPLPELTPGPWIRLEVSDTGTGIVPEVLPHIFEPFFTTKEPGQGTGLGLSQVYGIVKQHGGEIQVQTQVGQGTTFSIYLPAATGEARSRPVPQAVDIPGGQETILVVEDNPVTREALAEALGIYGYRVLAAENPVQAMQIMAEHGRKVALVLSDMVMPEQSGLDLYRELQAQGYDVPLIILTGYPIDPRDQEALSQGLVTWLQKPVGLEELAFHTRRMLDTHRRRTHG